MTCGIYQIRNTRTGNLYVGQSSNIEQRFRQHRREMLLGISKCRVLQLAWNKHGAEAFAFEMIIICARPSLNLYENAVIAKIDPRYNVMRAGVGDGGSAIPDDVREKIAASKRGKKRPGHVGIAVAEANRRRIVSAESRIKMSEQRRGKPVHSLEWREHLRERFSGEKNPMYGKRGQEHPLYGVTQKWAFRAVVNLETGEIFESLTAAAKAVARSVPRLVNSMKRGQRCAGMRFSYA